MALGADVDMEVFAACGAGRDDVATAAGGLDLGVLRVSVCFHGAKPLVNVRKGRAVYQSGLIVQADAPRMYP